MGTSRLQNIYISHIKKIKKQAGCHYYYKTKNKKDKEIKYNHWNKQHDNNNNNYRRNDKECHYKIDKKDNSYDD